MDFKRVPFAVPRIFWYFLGKAVGYISLAAPSLLFYVVTAFILKVVLQSLPSVEFVSFWWCVASLLLVHNFGVVWRGETAGWLKKNKRRYSPYE